MRLRPRLALTVLGVLAPTMLALVWFDKVAQHRTAEQLLVRLASAYVASSRAECEAEPSSWGGRIPPQRGAFGPDAGGSRPPRRGPRDVQTPPPWTPGEPAPAPPPRPPPAPPPGPPPAPPSEPRGWIGPAHDHAAPALAFAYDPLFHAQNPNAPRVPASLSEGLRDSDVASGPSLWSSKVEVVLRTPWGTGPCAFVLAVGSTDPTWGRVLPDTRIWLFPMALVFGAVLLAIGPVVRRVRRLEESVRRSAEVDYEAAVTIDGRDEIAELARAFDTARRTVRALANERERQRHALSEFVANTTHDVAIPLTVLLGHLTTLREGLSEGHTEQGKVVAAAMNEAHYLSALLQNLGLAARLDDASEPQRMDVDMNELLLRVMARHMPIARELGIALDSALPEAPVIVSADVTLLEQAASNIVYNAVRYNAPGGHVAIVLERRAEATFGLRVIDDGPGIDPEELARAVERGVRGDEARTRAPQGQGLGLSIVRRAAELHGFRLTLRRSEYGGLEVDLEGAEVVHRDQ